MREILFRGKRLDNGKWVEGFYCKHDTVKVCFTTDDPKSKHLIIGDGFCDWGFEPPLQGVEVAPSTIGQYTGLKDKNSKRIFEGDLLNGFEYPFLSDNKHNYFVEVIWFDNCPAFGIYTHKHRLSEVGGISVGNCDIIEDFDGSQWEVIGNIHDNPELLEGGGTE